MGHIKKNDKRERLVSAADDLILKMGFSHSTLADIAKTADIPLGNVYYYFKTKDSILDAVILNRSVELQRLTEEWEASLSPQKCIEAYIVHQTTNSDETAHYGSALGSLCQELGKFGGTSAMNAAKLMHDHLSWLSKQFTKILKHSKQAELAAEQLLAKIQGLSLLTLTFKDPSILKKSPERLLNSIMSQFRTTKTAA